MNDQLMKEIRIELGAEKPKKKDFVSARSGLCHPVCTSDRIESKETLDGIVLETPIECGSRAYIYNGYANLGAVSDDGTIFISGEGLKTPERARAANMLLTFPDHMLDPDTWVYSAGGKSSYVGSDGLLVSAAGIEGKSEPEKDVSASFPGKLKFYIEYIMEMLAEFDGVPDIAVQGAQEVGYEIHARGREYSDILTAIDNLIISEDLIMDSLDLRHVARSQPVAGRVIWNMKQDMHNIVNAVRGLPTQFKA